MTRRPPAAATARYEYLSRAAQRSGTPRARRALRPQADVSEATSPTRPFPVQVRNPWPTNHRSAHLRCAPIRLPACSPGTPTTARLCIACCDCGEVLAGAAEPWRQVTEAEEESRQIAPEDVIFEAIPSTATFSDQPASKASARWPTPTTPTASASTRSLSAATTSSTSSPTASPRPSSCCRNSSPTNGGPHDTGSTTALDRQKQNSQES